MSKQSILNYFVVFVVYLMLQVFLFDNMVLFGTAFCFIYIGFILFLPLEISKVFLIGLGFLAGLSVDIFYNSLGVNAASATLVAYLRPFWLSTITPSGGYEDVRVPVLKEMGFTWIITYALPLIFLHHLSLFIIEAGEMFHFGLVLKKTFFSCLFTFIILVIGQNLFYNRDRYS
jgi:hypothetical protein